MSEIVKQWIKEMINDKIEEAFGTIANERIWANGADDPEIHEHNIELNEELIEELTQIQENL